MLLREVYHRVKNNLQMMQSLVRLSAARAPPAAEPLFTDLASRLGAIGQLHSRIYASGNLTEIDAGAYVADVVDQVDAAFGLLQQRVRITKHLQPIMVDVDAAIPLGLITTELLTNAYRHAYPAECRWRHSRRIDVAGRHRRTVGHRQRRGAAAGGREPGFLRTVVGTGTCQADRR